MNRRGGALTRQWALVRELAAAKRGLSVRQLVERTGSSRSTLYRDLATLERAGVPIVHDTCNGEARLSLDGAELPPLRPTPAQLAALGLVRSLAAPLEGTELVAAYDEILTALRGRAEPAARLDATIVPLRPSPPPMKTVASAVRSRRCVRLVYRAASRDGEPRTYDVEPVGIRMADGDAYVGAVLLGTDDVRRFRATRIVSATMLEGRISTALTLEEIFAGARKGWGGEIVEVRVRLSPRVAWRANERPLAEGQVVKMGADGSAIVSARIAGITEAAGWVIAWGREAEAIAPRELRERVMGELAGALRAYGPGVVRASERVVSRKARRIGAT